MSEYESTREAAQSYVRQQTGTDKDEELDNTFRIVQQQYRNDPSINDQSVYAIAAGRVIYEHEQGEIRHNQAELESNGQMRMRV